MLEDGRLRLELPNGRDEPPELDELALDVPLEREELMVDAPDGRIVTCTADNAYADLGKPRQHVTSHDLRVSLDAMLAGRPVPAPETEALGCYITDPASIGRKP